MERQEAVGTLAALSQLTEKHKGAVDADGPGHRLLLAVCAQGRVTALLALLALGVGTRWD